MTSCWTLQGFFWTGWAARCDPLPAFPATPEGDILSPSPLKGGRGRMPPAFRAWGHSAPRSLRENLATTSARAGRKDFVGRGVCCQRSGRGKLRVRASGGVFRGEAGLVPQTIRQRLTRVFPGRSGQISTVRDALTVASRGGGRQRPGEPVGAEQGGQALRSAPPEGGSECRRNTWPA